MLEIIILSIVQGITEFLPISSSAHLILFANYLKYNNQNLILDISLHLGSLLAVLFFFKQTILDFFENKSLFLKILIGSLPTLVFGYLLVKLEFIDLLRNTYIIGITTILFGIILYFSDKSEEKNIIINDLKIKDTIYIGLLQCLSLIPGVSRSGITLTGARFLKFNRVEAAKISFLFSIPTLITISFYNIFKIVEIKNIQFTVQNFWAIILAFIFSFITLKIFINFLKKFSLIIFVIYRFFLGILIFIYAFI